jgi:mRNA-degrading endonuclease RelE of RelBE toxin-antitoxin system
MDSLSKFKLKLDFSKKAEKFYKKLEKKQQKEILRAFKKLKEFYYYKSIGVGTKLNINICKMSDYKYDNAFRIRTANYRVIFTPFLNEIRIFIIDMNTREKIYKK